VSARHKSDESIQMSRSKREAPPLPPSSLSMSGMTERSSSALSAEPSLRADTEYIFPDGRRVRQKDADRSKPPAQADRAPLARDQSLNISRLAERYEVRLQKLKELDKMMKGKPGEQ
jgi:hypothetical protein